MSKEDKILIKNIATRKEVWYEEIACRVPNKHWPLTTVKHLQQKIDDTTEWSTDNLLVKENKKLLLNKNAV